MTTTARGRIPRLICASCISSALLISAGATTAIAATQSPVPVQQIPRDDSGGSSDTGDQNGNGTTSNGDHQPSDNGGGNTGDQSGNGSDTGNQPSDTNGHPNTPPDNGVNTGDQSSNGGTTSNHPSTDNGNQTNTPSGHGDTGTGGRNPQNRTDQTGISQGRQNENQSPYYDPKTGRIVAPHLPKDMQPKKGHIVTINVPATVWASVKDVDTLLKAGMCAVGLSPTAAVILAGPETWEFVPTTLALGLPSCVPLVQSVVIDYMNSHPQ